MQSRKVLLPCVTSLFVLSISGLALSHHPWSPPPPSSTSTGPVQEMDYDVTTDILLGLPNGAPPLSSFERDPFTVDLPGNISAYPPDPCYGIAQVWNAVLGNKGLGFWQRREFASVVLQVMATNQCAAQLVWDESTSPATLVSIQPIPAP
jgi:hypothetical protein